MKPSVHLVVLTGLTIIAACGGGSGTGTTMPVPCPLELAQPAPPDLLYSIPGATGVPDGNFQLIVGYPTTPFAPPVLAPTPAGPSTTGATFTAAPTPLPSPMATPRSSIEMLFGSAIPALQSATTYEVTFTFGPAIPGCPNTENAGSFTTR